ncbi:hypothetical protein [Nitrosomonas sp. ANs5]|uniref:hypothetical protein n=1 Tax=Nitrosomonas sp. ANs5 TaxID=3423941 RepID=UPI003D357857
MRYLLSVILMLAITLPTFAQQAMATASAEAIVILGYQIPAPVQVDQPIKWEAVREYVPAALYNKPAAPMTPQEIFDEISRLLKAKGQEYKKALSALAIARAGDYPDLHPETVELMLAERFVGGQGESISPDVQRLVHEYAALLYLREAFGDELRAQGINPPITLEQY